MNDDNDDKNRFYYDLVTRVYQKIITIYLKLIVWCNLIPWIIIDKVAKITGIFWDELFLEILIQHLWWIIWSPLQDHTDFSFDKSFSGVRNSSGINVCTKSLGGVDGGPSEDQVSTRNICVKNDINEDIYKLLWK
jgi:hypothetical protein